MSRARKIRWAAAASLAALTLSSSACSPRAEVLWPEGIVRLQGRGRIGAEQGRWTYRYRDGQARERGKYRSGRRIGVWMQWYPNGQRANEGERHWSETTRASERHGPWSFWHENGVLRARGSYDLGVRVGDWTFWNDKGVVDEARSGLYVDGLKSG